MDLLTSLVPRNPNGSHQLHRMHNVKLRTWHTRNQRPSFGKFSLLQNTFLLYLRKKSVTVHLHPSHPARNKVTLKRFGKSFRGVHRSQRRLGTTCLDGERGCPSKMKNGQVKINWGKLKNSPYCS